MLSLYVKDKDRIYPLISLLIGSLFFIMGLFFVKEAWFLYYLGSIVITLLCFGFYRPLLRVALLIVPISLFVYLLTRLGTNHGNALQNAYRTLLLGLSAVITLSIEPVDLVRNLNGLKIPRIISLALLITLRFMGVISEEIKRIRIAMKTRGVNSNFYHPKVAYRAFLIPLIMRVISISDILSISLDTRGFKRDGAHSNYKDIKVRKNSLLFLLLSTLILGISTYFYVIKRF